MRLMRHRTMRARRTACHDSHATPNDEYPSDVGTSHTGSCTTTMATGPDALPPEAERARQLSRAAVVDRERASRLAPIFLDSASPREGTGTTAALVLVLRLVGHRVARRLSGHISENG